MVSPKHSGAHDEPTSPQESPLPGTFRIRFDRNLERFPSSRSDVETILSGDPLRLLTAGSRTKQVWTTLAAGHSIAQTAVTQKVSEHSVAKLVDGLLSRGVAHPLTDLGLDDSALQDPAELTARLSFVIPVKDRPTELARLLSSIRAEFSGTIVIVDDGSLDSLHPLGSTGENGSGSGQVIVLRNEVSRGPAAARNYGARTVNTEFIAFVDSDCSMPPGWGHAWVNALTHFNDPRVGVVAPRITAMPNTERPLLSKSEFHLYAYESVRSPLDLGSTPAAVRPMSKVAYVPSAALIVRSTAFNTTASRSGFDETMQVGEDVDFIWREVATGNTVRYDPSLTVQHDHRTKLRDFVRRRMQYNTSAAVLDRTHPGLVPPLVLSPWSATAWAALLTQTPLGSAVAASIATYSTGALAKKLEAVQEPLPLAIKLAARGHFGAGRQLASATWRTYLPVALVGALISKRVRRWLVLSALVHNTLDYRDRRPPMNYFPYLALRLLDDAASCVGVWTGAWRTRNPGPLRPKFINWPGRNPPT